MQLKNVKKRSKWLLGNWDTDNKTKTGKEPESALYKMIFETKLKNIDANTIAKIALNVIFIYRTCPDSRKKLTFWRESLLLLFLQNKIITSIVFHL